MVFQEAGNLAGRFGVSFNRICGISGIRKLGSKLAISYCDTSMNTSCFQYSGILVGMSEFPFRNLKPKCQNEVSNIVPSMDMPRKPHFFSSVQF